MWDDIFLIPFLTGLCLAITLPILGCFLRLRDEWLAALAYSHVAAAGALLALLAGVQPVLGGLSMAALAGAGRRLFAQRLSGGASDALLLVGGWAIAVLLAANAPMAERLGHALFDGQLYFASSQELWPVAIGGIVALLALRALSSRLLLARVYPDLFRLRGLRIWPTQVGFDMMAALCLALATMSLGVMGAFALVFVFRLRIALALAIALVLGYGRRTGFLEQWPNVRALAFLGQISYSIFLVHFPVLLIANSLYARLNLDSTLSAMIALVLAWATSIAAATLFYRWIESPEASRRITSTLGWMFDNALAIARKVPLIGTLLPRRT